LGGGEKRLWDNRGHFFAAAAESMRRILIDRARARMRAKRGGGRPLAALDENAVACEDRPQELLALHEALAELERDDERAARIVKLRYFAGLSVEETAEAVAVTPRTVMRDWAAARAWLAVRMAEGPPR
jgi:RNA polymerase sigma factor (TIGR02999 family)